jgi:hypothetical protein
MRAAILARRAGKISLPGEGGADVQVQVGESPRAQAAGAVAVGGGLCLFERMFGLPQRRRSRRDAQPELAGGLQLAREIEQRMFGKLAGGHGARSRHGQQAQQDDGQRAFQAEAFRLLRPPRNERQARKPCERSRAAAAALRLPVAHISR